MQKLISAITRVMNQHSQVSLVICITLMAFTLLVLAPVLFDGKVFSGEEQFGFYYPINAYYQQSLQNSTSLLWNSAYYGGVSASLDQFVSAFFPIKRIIFSLLPLYAAHHWSIALGVIVGLLLAYAFARTQGWSYGPSLIFALSYFAATSFGWLQIGTIAAYSFITLPGLALALYRIKQRRSYFGYALLGGIALGIGFLAGFVQIVFYAYALAFLYALFLDYNKWTPGKNLPENGRATIAFGIISLIGLLIGARQIAVSAELIGETIRTSRYALENIYPASPVELLTLFFPDYIRIPFIGGGANGFYVGALSLFFAAIGLLFYRSRTAIFFFGSYLLLLGFAFYLPGFGWLNTHLPPFSHLGSAARWLVVGSFPLAYLAGFGFQKFLESPDLGDKGRRRKVLKILGWGSGLVVLGGLAVSLALRELQQNPALLERIIAWRFSNRPMSFPLSHYEYILNGALTEFIQLFSLRSPKFIFAILLWPAAFMFLLWAWRKARSSRMLEYVATGMIIVNIAGVAVLEWDTMIPQSIYEQKPAIIATIQSRETNPWTYRTMGFLIGDGLFWELTSKKELDLATLASVQRELVINNSNVFWDVQKIDGMEPYRTLQSNQLLNTVIAADKNLFVFNPESPKLLSNPLNRLENIDVLQRVTLEEKKQDFLEKLPLLSALNVKYIYSIYPLSHPLLLEIPLALGDAFPLSLHLYENKTVLPRIYFAKSARFISGGPADRAKALLRVKNFAEETLIECDTCIGRETSDGGKIQIERYENGLLELTATSPSGGWLIFSESYLPGWGALVDGTPTAIYPANYLFQAIEVPRGTHRISFRYRDVIEQRVAKLHLLSANSK